MIAVRFEEGQLVRRGQLLVELDGAQARADLAAAQAALAESRSAYARSKDLFAQQALSQAQLEVIEATGRSLAEWQAIPGATGYRVELATDASFTTLWTSANTTATSLNVSGLGVYTVYRWRVRASNGYGDGNWSEVRTFTTRK